MKTYLPLLTLLCLLFLATTDTGALFASSGRTEFDTETNVLSIHAATVPELGTFELTMSLLPDNEAILFELTETLTINESYDNMALYDNDRFFLNIPDVYISGTEDHYEVNMLHESDIDPAGFKVFTTEYKECLMEEEEALASLDLTDERTKEIHDILLTVDPLHGYEVFIQAPDDFMFWLNDLNTSLTTAVHETNHYVNGYDCFSSDYTYLLLGNGYLSNLEFDDTMHISIVEETIPDYLKEAIRYDIYIVDSKSANGNDLRILLDELSAYAGDAWFQIQFQESGLPAETEYYRLNQFQIDGVVNFMVYLQYYLKSTRLNYPDKYELIKSQYNTMGYIQWLWIKAEDIVREAYPFLISDFSVEYIFFDMAGDASGLGHLKEAYSDDLLFELDNLGIRHLPADAWNDTYFTHGSGSSVTGNGAGKSHMLHNYFYDRNYWRQNSLQ